VSGFLPELAAVPWRPRADERTLRRTGRLWTLTTVAHTLPFLAAAVGLAVLKPLTIPVGIVLLAHAWAIPELYANRGAKVLRPRRSEGRIGGDRRGAADGETERVAAGLLGDLLGHAARELHARSGLVLERGRLGLWLLGEAGAVLVRPGARRIHCYCVGVTDPELPGSDRKAHLLLALREDEAGFATVANQAFSGAAWRVARRLGAQQRLGLEAARNQGRSSPGPISSSNLCTEGQCAA
jgi:hypothetical protein